jgi:hypothetical protein
VGKPEGKRPLGRPRHRWVDNIKIDLREIGWDGMDWIDLAQDGDQCKAFVASIKCGEEFEYLHNWQLLKKGSQLHEVVSWYVSGCSAQWGFRN